jgi:signal transduction histidine kinase
MRHEGTVARLLSRAFILLVALFIAAGAVELTAVLIQHRAAEELIHRVQPLELANDRLRAVLADAQRSLRGYLLTGDGQMLETYAQAKSDYFLAVQSLQNLSTGSDRTAASEQIVRADAWWAVADRQRLALPRSDDAAAYAERGKTLLDAFIAANEQEQNTLAVRAEQLHRRVDRLQWISIVVMVTLTVGVGLMAAAVAVRTSRRITRPLAAVADVLDRRRAGDREVRADPAAGPEEIRWVAEAVNATADHSETVRRKDEELMARLQSLDTVKTDFMSTVSHELRTPLTSISGYVELLREPENGTLSDPQRRMLEVIARNARRLRDLVEDILTLSRIEAGEFASDLDPVDLAEVVERGVSAIGPTAAKASVHLHLEVTGPLPVRGDGAQLDRVLDNLLSNAVKFTPAEGTVTIRAVRREADTELVVADTGMGIPEDEQQALFARFFRATNAIRQAVPGTGLGLAIVHTIVTNHGGRIEVDSIQDVGTTVTLRLPAA